MPESDSSHRAFSDLLHPEQRFIARLRGVLRFEREIWAEIQADPRAIPQAFAVVIAAALLAGIGQPSLALVFLAMAGFLVTWFVITIFVWTIATFAVDEEVRFSKILRCSGFAYVWMSLLALSRVWAIGPLFGWGGLALMFASLVAATREVFAVETPRALAICAVAFGLPAALLLGLHS